MKEKGFTLWFTGLSGAGKSTIANILVERLHDAGRYVELLDGDEVRTNLTADLGFSKEDRDENIKRIAFVAKLLSRNGVIAITAAISPYLEAREKARSDIADFVEVFIDCPVEVCAQRDVKGLYEKAMRGEIPHFTGVSDPYEPPTRPDIWLHTNEQTVEESVDAIISELHKMGLLPELVAV